MIAQMVIFGILTVWNGGAPGTQILAIVSGPVSADQTLFVREQSSIVLGHLQQLTILVRRYIAFKEHAMANVILQSSTTVTIGHFVDEEEE